MDEKLVLQLAVPAVKHHVRPRPEVAVDDALVRAQPRVPLGGIVADQVIDASRRWALSPDGDIAARAEEGQCQRETVRRALFVLESKHCFPAGEEERKAGALRGVAHARIGLAGVRDERERQLPIGVQGVLLRRRRGRPAQWRG